MRPEIAELDFSPDRDAPEVRATTGRALMHTPLPQRTEGDDPKRAAFVNRLVREHRIYSVARAVKILR